MRKDAALARELARHDAVRARAPRACYLLDEAVRAMTFARGFQKSLLEDAVILLGFHADRGEEISGEMEAEYRALLGLRKGAA